MSSAEQIRLAAAQTSADAICTNIEIAKAVARSRSLLQDHSSEAWANLTFAHAFNLIACAHPGFKIDFTTLSFDAHPSTSTQHVLEAARDPGLSPLPTFFSSAFDDRELTDVEAIGISITDSAQLIPAISLACFLRQRLGNRVRLVLGGNYITRIASRWKALHAFLEIADGIVIGEGEKPLIELAEQISCSAYEPDNISSFCYMQRDKLYFTKRAALKLDELPSPDFSDLPLGKYFAPDVIFPIYSSRSCAHKCAFCSIPWASNNFRQRSSSRLIGDITHLQRKHGARYFFFVDETFEVPAMERVIDLIREHALDVRWFAETRFSPRITPPLCRRLRQSGCRLLQFGLESYSQRVLDLMRKGTRVEHARPVLEALLENDIAFHLFAFVGFPGETADEALKTLEFVTEMAAAAHSKGNPYCSNAVGVFNLEHLAPVAQDPQAFGIELEPEVEGEDLSTQGRYRVLNGGLTNDQAASLLEEWTGYAALREHQEANRVAWLSLALSFKPCWEEWNFLRMCYTEERITPQGVLNASKSALSLGIKTAEFPVNPKRTSKVGPFEGYFSPVSGLFACLTPSETRDKDRRIERLCQITDETDSETRMMCEFRTFSSARLLYSPSRDEYYIADDDLEQVMRVNKSAALVYSLLERHKTIFQIFTAAQALRAVLSLRDIEMAVKAFCRHGFVYMS
jgi:hypothetical protein